MTDDLIATIQRAEELYRMRAEAGAVKESVALLIQLPGGAEKFEVQWRLSRAFFFLGQQAESRGARRQMHAAGIDTGERAARVNPERVEGHFWLGVNLALFAEAQRGWKGAVAVRRAQQSLRNAAAIAETYHGAGPLRVLARLLDKAPRLLGGSHAESRRLFDRALRLAPTNSVTLLYAAEQAVRAGESERAALLLRTLLMMPPDPDWQFENLRDRQIARKLLAEIGEGD